MTRRLFAVASLLSVAALFVAGACAQEAIGTVSTTEARVTGGLEVRGEHATLLTNASVTAYDRTAPIELTRGGLVLVCSTSQFHLLHSGAGQSLTFGLDRGAIEIHSPAQPQDVLQTPDLRFTFSAPGQLDLKLRVTPNGDTCVDNAGTNAPEVSVSDVFTDATYRLKPGQHVLFKNGSLHEVVDSERSPCGCPPPLPPAQVAEAPVGGTTNSDQASAANPFPAAVSQGLAPETKPANNTPGETHVQVASTLAFGDDAAPKPSVVQTATPVKETTLTPPATPPGAHDIFHAIGHFFHRLFHGKPQS